MGVNARQYWVIDIANTWLNPITIVHVHGSRRWQCLAARVVRVRRQGCAPRGYGRRWLTDVRSWWRGRVRRHGCARIVHDWRRLQFWPHVVRRQGCALGVYGRRWLTDVRSGWRSRVRRHGCALSVQGLRGLTDVRSDW